MTDVKPGDRIQVTYESTSKGYGIPSPADVLVGDLPDGTPVYLDPDASDRHVVSVEVLEPDWQPGDVACDQDGRILVRVDGYVSEFGRHYDWLENGRPRRGVNKPSGTLTLLVRDGKAVA